jgi:hypothetical protein
LTLASHNIPINAGGHRDMEDKRTKQLDLEKEDFLSGSASATDCTGLIMRPVQSKEEAEAYEEVYPYLPKAVRTKEDSGK